MYRFEARDVTVRWDAFETRVSVERYDEHNSMTVRELDKLIEILQKARAAREDVGAGMKRLEKKAKKR